MMIVALFSSEISEMSSPTRLLALLRTSWILTSRLTSGLNPGRLSSSLFLYWSMSWVTLRSAL